MTKRQALFVAHQNHRYLQGFELQQAPGTGPTGFAMPATMDHDDRRFFGHGSGKEVLHWDEGSAGPGGWHKSEQYCVELESPGFRQLLQ